MKMWKAISIAIPAILSVYSAVLADPYLRPGHRGAHGNRVVVRENYTRVVVRNHPYFYRYGHFYGRRRHAYFLVEPPLGVTVGLLPPAAIRLRFGPTRFYYYGGIYYRAAPGGYVVVPRPETVYIEKTDASQPDEPFQEPMGTVVMVNNSNGSKTPVRLEELEGGKYKGPRDEIYDALPTQEQLHSAYGF